MSEKHRQFIRRHKVGYEVWDETSAVDFEAFVISGDESGEADVMAKEINDRPPALVTVRSCYTPRGEYIGNTGMAHRLCQKRGIVPECLPGNEVCSIGWCPSEQKWYGWSHRAIFGFGLGAEVKEGDCCASSGWTDEYLAEHPDQDTSLPIGFKAESWSDCRRMAIAFAESVS